MPFTNDPGNPASEPLIPYRKSKQSQRHYHSIANRPAPRRGSSPFQALRRTKFTQIAVVHCTGRCTRSSHTGYHTRWNIEQLRRHDSSIRVILFIGFRAGVPSAPYCLLITYCWQRTDTIFFMSVPKTGNLTGEDNRYLLQFKPFSKAASGREIIFQSNALVHGQFSCSLLFQITLAVRCLTCPLKGPLACEH